MFSSCSTVGIGSGQWVTYRLHWPGQTVLLSDLLKLVWILYYVDTTTIQPVFLEKNFFPLFGKKRSLCHWLRLSDACSGYWFWPGSALEGTWEWQMNSKGNISLKFQDILVCLYLHNRFVKIHMHHLCYRRITCRSMAALDTDTSLHAVNIIDTLSGKTSMCAAPRITFRQRPHQKIDKYFCFAVFRSCYAHGLLHTRMNFRIFHWQESPHSTKNKKTKSNTASHVAYNGTQPSNLIL